MDIQNEQIISLEHFYIALQINGINLHSTIQVVYDFLSDMIYENLEGTDAFKCS